MGYRRAGLVHDLQLVVRQVDTVAENGTRSA